MIAVTVDCYKVRIQQGRQALQIVAHYYALSPEARRAAEVAFNACPTHASECYLAIKHSLNLEELDYE